MNKDIPYSIYCKFSNEFDNSSNDSYDYFYIVDIFIVQDNSNINLIGTMGEIMITVTIVTTFDVTKPSI